MLAYRCEELHAEIARLKTALKGEKDATWQPIETAPLDGTIVLVVDDGGVYTASFSSLSGWTLDTSPQVGGHPTHWMPLPELPSKGKKDAS